VVYVHYVVAVALAVDRLPVAEISWNVS